MISSIKQNRAIGNRRKTFRDQEKGNRTKSISKAPTYREMSAKERKKLSKKLESNRFKSHRQLIFVTLFIIVVSIFVLLKIMKL